tara:strand:- start:530 stop:1330 length:801 start_codon:yes stop_codon:yes gene_type:complete
VFNRQSQTYDFDLSTVQNILRDIANPLNRISEIIPDNAKVLDIGAGNGLLAYVLKENHNGLTIDGVEPDPHAAKLAVKNYRHFYTGVAEDFIDIISKEDYDFIVLADVIEHVNDPLAFLKSICSRVDKKTRIILSIPNIAFGAVRISLLNGEFNYVDSGIIERTHIRFFTLKTIETLVSELHMSIEKLYFLQRNILTSEINLQKFQMDICCFLKIIKDSFAWTYQFLVVLNKESVRTEKKIFGEIPKYPLFKFVLHKFLNRKNLTL